MQNHNLCESMWCWYNSMCWIRLHIATQFTEANDKGGPENKVIKPDNNKGKNKEKWLNY